MSKPSSKSVLRALFLASPVLILAILAWFHSPDKRRAAHDRALRQIKDVVVRWADKHYVSLTDRPIIQAALDHVEVEGPSLTPEMRAAYSKALVDFFFAFKDGSIESWKRFRFHGQHGSLTPEGIHNIKWYYGWEKDSNYTIPDFTPNDSSFDSLWLEKMQTPNALPPPPKSEAELEALFYKLVPEVSHGTFYKDYFQGICVDEMILRHDRYPAMPPPLTEYPFFPLIKGGPGEVDATFPNLGYQIWSNHGPTITFFRVVPTLPDLLKEQGAVDCMNAFVFVKINEAGKAAPFLLRHVWNPHTHRWAVAEVVDAHISSYTRILSQIIL